MCKGRDCVRQSEVRRAGQVLPDGDRDEEIQMCEKQVRLGLSGGGGVVQLQVEREQRGLK